MKPSKRKFFSGNTVQQAVVAAANEYGLAPSEIAYRQIEKRHGFLRSRKRVVIAVDPQAPRLATPEASPAGAEEASLAGVVASPVEEVSPPEPSLVEPHSLASDSSEAGPLGTHPTSGVVVPGPSSGPAPAPPAPLESELVAPSAAPAASATPGPSAVDQAPIEESQEQPPKAEPQRAPRKGRREGGRRDRRPVANPEAVRAAGDEAMAKMVTLTGLDLSWTVSDSEEGIEVEIAGPDADLLLEEHGKAIFAMEHLLPKLVRGISGESAYCQIDCLNFKADRLEELRKLALNSADEVRKSGEPKTLKLLNPAERRLVHMALADQEGVETESEGRGYLKRLTIWPTDD